MYLIKNGFVKEFGYYRKYRDRPVIYRVNLRVSFENCSYSSTLPVFGNGISGNDLIETMCQGGHNKI